MDSPVSRVFIDLYPWLSIFPLYKLHIVPFLIISLRIW